MIAATLETFGAGIARESVFVREYEASFAKRLAGSGAGRHKIQSVGEWLDSFGLGQYENTLVANGFDDTDFLGDQKALPESVESWLETLRLGQYLDTFVSHKYDTMQRVVKLWELELNTRVVKLWELELNTVLDISSLGHRKRILASLGDRLAERDSSLSPARVRRRSAEEEPRSPFEHIDLYRDYTGVKARAPDNGEQRSPENSPLMTFDKVGENGPLSSQKSTEVINKIPTIMLSISYKGVKFIDAKSKKVICDHEIANIFCACQDGDHMNFFAYVTKDKETGKHYCHVFSVRSRWTTRVPEKQQEPLRSKLF
nr:hypothetical protein BaRGS_000688 [Batillaria attramentaria]